jgi:hypothetical protein
LLAPRYARLTGLACLALLLLAGAWLGLSWLGMRVPALGLSAGRFEPMAIASLLLQVTVFFGGSLLALSAALAWLGASIWHFRLATLAERASGPAGSKPFMQRLMAASAQTRRAMEARQDEVARVTSPVHVHLADFEMGKVLHRWPRGRVQRGRQKSLDRPVLIWQETGAAPDGDAMPGVHVRHPALLSLYAVGAGPEGRFLVTEPVTAVPLADLLERTSLTPLQAASLAARLARIIEAFHAQGACHGRLSADWVLVRADLEPVLCPCAMPCRSDEDRARDIQALGDMLQRFFDGRRSRAAQPLAQIGAAARLGDYARAADLASDLDRAAGMLRTRWRARLSASLFVFCAIVPWLALAVWGQALIPYLLLALAPSSLLLGYIHARTVIVRRRLQHRLLRKMDSINGALPLVLLILPAALLVGRDWTVAGPAAAGAQSVLLATAELLVCWLAGACLAGLVTLGEAVWDSLQLGRSWSAR